jgi:hypothetical protein
MTCVSTVLTRVQQSGSARYRRNKRIIRVAPVEGQAEIRKPRGTSKRKKTTMKKLMIATAAVALAAVAQAGIVVTNCTPHIDADCPALVFKVTANGKATDAYSKDYTSVGKLKISKGALVMWPKDADNDEHQG